MHWRPTSVSANEGSSIRERTQWCTAVFNIEDVWCEEAFSHFFLSKNKHTLGSLGRKYNIHCGLSLLLHCVSLQSLPVCTGRGVVHIRPDSERAVVTSGFVPSYEDPTMASTVIFCKAGCVKSFSSSRSDRSTALFVIHVQTNSLLVAIQHNNLTLKALRETTRN